MRNSNSTTIGLKLKMPMEFPNKIKMILILIFFSFALISCSDDDDQAECISFETEDVTTVNAPETAEVGETVNIEVGFLVSNSCGEFNKFLETGTETSRVITVEAIYEGCVCNEVFEPLTAIYTFTPDEPGEYELNFNSVTSEGDVFITVILTVTEAQE